MLVLGLFYFSGYYGPMLCRIWMLTHWPRLLRRGALCALLLLIARLLSSSLFESDPDMQGSAHNLSLIRAVSRICRPCSEKSMTCRKHAARR